MTTRLCQVLLHHLEIPSLSPRTGQSRSLMVTGTRDEAMLRMSLAFPAKTLHHTLMQTFPAPLLEPAAAIQYPDRAGTHCIVHIVDDTVRTGTRRAAIVLAPSGERQ